MTSKGVMRLGIFWIVPILLISWCGHGLAEQEPNYERLVNAIYKAEGGEKTSHPYGILARYKITTPRQACLNTVRNQWKRHQAHKCGMDYWHCLWKRYCPVGAKNDPGKLNKNWLKNVMYFYEVR